MQKPLGILIIFIGILLLFNPVLANTYSLFYQNYVLEKELVKPNTEAVENIETAPGEVGARLPPIKPPFKIVIPKISLEAVVVNGVEEGDLRKGPGLYPEGVLPGEDGNTAIAGHRNTYGKWFLDLDKLVEGDQIHLLSDNRKITYEVERLFVVKSTDWSVIDPTPYKALTLTTCNLPDAKTKRLIIRAKQIRDEELEGNTI